MMNNATTRAVLIFCCAVAGALLVQGYRANRVLQDKAASQAAATETVQRWRQNYLALGGTVKRWNTTYHPEAGVEDLMSLFEVAGFIRQGLQVDIDKTVIQKVEPVTQNGAAIGLTRVCLVTSGAMEGGTLEAAATTYPGLVKSIEELAARPDVFIGAMSFRADRASPVMALGDFCLLLRNG